MKIAIIDSGIGNLGSVRRALDELGAMPLIASTPADLDPAHRIILPGVGSFTDGMASLHDGGWVDALHHQVHTRGKDLLGICLGMHLLASRGEEGAGKGYTPGLDLIPGDIMRLDKLGCQFRIPHVGWNEVKSATPSPLFTGIADGTDFYFVHSYAFTPADPANILLTCDYDVEFTAAIGRNRVWGTQFHPEKSSKAGIQVLKNFLEMP